MFLYSKRLILAFGLLLFGLCSFGQVKSGAFRLMLKGLLSHSVPETGVQQALKETGNVIFVDAREPKEYDVSHLKGAILVGYDQFDPKNLLDLPRTQPIIVYCSVGYRSEKVAEKLQKLGFSQVSNLYGGIFEWINQGLPVYDEKGATEKVHAYNHTWAIWLKRGKKVF